MSSLVLFRSCGVFFFFFFFFFFLLGDERANRTFIQFALVWFCLFPLPRGVVEGL